MFHQIFYWVLNMSIYASIAGAAVILLRLIKKIPHRMFIFFWLAPFLRMCIPFGLDSRYSLMNMLLGFAAKSISLYDREMISISAMNSVRAAETYFPLVYKTDMLESIFRIGGMIWFTVFIALIITLLVLYISTLCELSGGERSGVNVYFSEKITSPAVYGIIRPKIILPSALKNRDIKYILLHENTHIKSGDNFWRMLAIVISAAHWFNPLAWLFLKNFLSDLELACDERSLAGLDESQIREYAHCLLNFHRSPDVFVSAFGGAAVRTRIENIVSFKKLTRLSILGFTALLAAILYILLTNAG